WLAYVHRARLPILPLRICFVIVTAAIAAIWLFHFAYIEDTFDGLCRSAAWMLVFPAVICATCMLILPSLDADGARRSSTPAERLLYFLGVASYAVYVLHASYMTTLPALLQLVIAYAAAFAVFVGFERPLFRLRVA